MRNQGSWSKSTPPQT